MDPFSSDSQISLPKGRIKGFGVSPKVERKLSTNLSKELLPQVVQGKINGYKGICFKSSTLIRMHTHKYTHQRAVCFRASSALALGKQSTTTAASPSNRVKDYEGRILGLPELLSTPLNKSLNSMRMVEPSKETYLLVSM